MNEKPKKKHKFIKPNSSVKKEKAKPKSMLDRASKMYGKKVK